MAAIPDRGRWCRGLRPWGQQAGETKTRRNPSGDRQPAPQVRGGGIDMDPVFASHLQVATAPQVRGTIYILEGYACRSAWRPANPSRRGTLLFPKSIDHFFLSWLHQGRARARSLRYRPCPASRWRAAPPTLFRGIFPPKIGRLPVAFSTSQIHAGRQPQNRRSQCH